MPDRFQRLKDPKKALEYFRSLPEDEQLTAVFAETSILRYELHLVEEFVRIFRRLFWPLIGAVVLLLALALSNYSINSSNRQVVERIEECTTPGTPCTNRSGSGVVCAVIALQNDNRLVNGYDPAGDGTVDTIPVPKECS